MKKLPYFLIILIYWTSCNNSSLPEHSKNSSLNDVIQKEVKKTYDSDTLTFSHFEEYINNDIEKTIKVPTEWIKSLTILDSSFYCENAQFKGEWIFPNGKNFHINIEDSIQYKLAHLKWTNKLIHKDLFISFTPNGNFISQKSFLIYCNNCPNWKFNSSISYLNTPDTFKIKVSYFDTTAQPETIHPKNLQIKNEEIWGINKDFCLVRLD